LEVWRQVAFFVAVHQQVRPEHLDEVLVTMRGDFATSQRLHPGRRSTRVFQRLNYPTHLLAVGEWDSQDAYEMLKRTPHYRAVTVEADPPARIEYLKRIRIFARMAARPAIAGCVMLAVSSEHADTLERFLLDEVRWGVESAPGLISHEVYRVCQEPGRLLVVHSWRSLDDLESFRSTDRKRYDATLAELGVSTERLTGIVAAQFSRLDSASDRAIPLEPRVLQDGGTVPGGSSARA
jgi:quinol monooxygenase YgiN